MSAIGKKKRGSRTPGDASVQPVLEVLMAMGGSRGASIVLDRFDWEEFYVFGPGDQEDYRELKKTQPSFKDRYDLLEIDPEAESEWMMFAGEDIAARVRRKSDGREFYLGLAELKATDRKSDNYQLLHDYAVWFINNR